MSADHEYDGQTTYLRKQLTALRKGPRSRWRRFRLLEWVCDSCGESVLEVMRTDPFRVYQVRRGIDDRREGAWSFVALPPVRPAGATQRPIAATCGCQDRMLTEAMLWDDLDEGRVKRTLPADHDPEYKRARRS